MDTSGGDDDLGIPPSNIPPPPDNKTTQEVFDQQLAFLDDFDKKNHDPIKTELMLVNSNLNNILNILAREFLASEELDDDLLDNDGDRVKGFLGDVVDDAANVDGTNSTLPEARWRKSKRRKSKRKGGDEGDESDDDEEDEALREELCGNFVHNVIRVVSDTVLGLRNTFAMSVGEKDIPENVKQEIQRLKALNTKKESMIESLAKKSEQAKERVHSMRDEVVELKAVSHGMDYKGIEALIHRCAALEKENEYLYTRIVGQEAQKGKIKTTRMVGSSANSSMVASMTSKIRAQQKRFQCLEKSAMYALDVDANGQRKGFRSVLDRAALGGSTNINEANKRMAALSQVRGTNHLDDDDDDVHLFGMSELPEIDPALPEEEKQKLRSTIESLRATRREARYQTIEKNNAEIVSRLVEPTVDHFTNVTEMLGSVQDVIASLPDNLSKKKKLSTEVNNFKKKIGSERDSLVSTIRFTCGSSKEAVTKFALLMKRKRDLRSADEEESSIVEESASVQQQLRDAATKKKEKERQLQVDKARVANIQSHGEFEEAQRSGGASGASSATSSARLTKSGKTMPSANKMVVRSTRRDSSTQTLPMESSTPFTSSVRSSTRSTPKPEVFVRDDAPINSQPTAATVSASSPRRVKSIQNVVEAIDVAMAPTFSASHSRHTTPPPEHYSNTASHYDSPIEEQVDDFFTKSGFAEPVAEEHPMTENEVITAKRRLKRKKKKSTSGDGGPSHKVYSTPIDFGAVSESAAVRAPSRSGLKRAFGAAAGSMAGPSKRHPKAPLPKIQASANATPTSSSLECPACNKSLFLCLSCGWKSFDPDGNDEDGDASNVMAVGEVKEILKAALTAGAAQQELKHQRAKANFRAIAANQSLKKRLGKKGDLKAPEFDRGVDIMLERAAKIKEGWEEKRKQLAAQNAAVSNFFYNRLQFALYGSSRRMKVRMPNLEQLLSFAEKVSYEKQKEDSEYQPPVEEEEAEAAKSSSKVDAQEVQEDQPSEPHQDLPSLGGGGVLSIPLGEEPFRVAQLHEEDVKESHHRGGLGQLMHLKREQNSRTPPPYNGQKAPPTPGNFSFTRNAQTPDLTKNGALLVRSIDNALTTKKSKYGGIVSLEEQDLSLPAGGVHQSPLQLPRSDPQPYEIRSNTTAMFLRRRAEEDAIMRNLEEQSKFQKGEEEKKLQEALVYNKRRVNVFASSNTPLPQVRDNRSKRWKVKNTLSLKTRDDVKASVDFILEAETFNDGLQKGRTY